MTNLDSILKKQPHYLPTKAHLVKAMVFPVVKYGCESWAIKKAEYWRTDAFELWCWRRLLRVPWTARRSNQSILKEISPEYSLEGLMLKLKLQYFGYLMQRTDSLEKTLMLGKTEGRRRKGRQWMKWFDGLSDLMDMNLSKLQELVMDREARRWGRRESDTTEWLKWRRLRCLLDIERLVQKDHIYRVLGQRGLQCRRAKIWPLQPLGFSCDEGSVRSSRNHMQISSKTPNNDFRALNPSP